MYYILALFIHLFGICSRRPYNIDDGKTNLCIICGKEVPEDKKK